MKIAKTVLAVGICSFLIVGCSTNDENKPAVSDELSANEKIVEQVEESNPSEEAEEVVEENNIYEEMTITNRNVPIVENDKGTMVFLGERVNDMGLLEVVMKATGDLTEVDLNPMAFEFVMDDGSMHALDRDNLQSYRFGEGYDLYVYESTDEVTGSKVQRMDFSRIFDYNGGIDEENRESIEIPDTSEMVNVEPLPSFTERVIPFSVMKEDDKKQVTIDQIEIVGEEMKDVQITGNVTLKEDQEGVLPVKVLQPQTNRDISSAVATNNDTFYAGVTTPYEINLIFPYPLSDDKGSQFNMSIDGLLFQIDLSNANVYDGEVYLNDLPTAEDQRFYEYAPADGFLDANGEPHYHAIQTLNGDGVMTYTLGGEFKTLTFDASVLKDADYRFSFDALDGEEERELNRETINGSDGIKHYELNVEGVRELRLSYTSNQIDKPTEEILPLLFTEPRLQK